MSATKLQVVFYSMYGHVYRLAEAVADGARGVADVEVADLDESSVQERRGQIADRQVTFDDLDRGSVGLGDLADRRDDLAAHAPYEPGHRYRPESVDEPIKKEQEEHQTENDEEPRDVHSDVGHKVRAHSAKQRERARMPRPNSTTRNTKHGTRNLG